MSGPGRLLVLASVAVIGLWLLGGLERRRRGVVTIVDL